MSLRVEPEVLRLSELAAVRYAQGVGRTDAAAALARAEPVGRNTASRLTRSFVDPAAEFRHDRETGCLFVCKRAREDPALVVAVTVIRVQPGRRA